MIERRLKNVSLVAIGKEFGVSDQTVARSLKWAEKNGLIESFEDQILNDLVPTAMKTLKEAMETGKDAQVALEVFKGIGLFKKHSDKTVATSSGESEDLESYLRNKRFTDRSGSPAPGPTLPPKPEVRVLEGELTGVGPENPQSPSETVVAPSSEDSPQDEDWSLGESSDGY